MPPVIRVLSISPSPTVCIPVPGGAPGELPVPEPGGPEPGGFGLVGEDAPVDTEPARYAETRQLGAGELEGQRTGIRERRCRRAVFLRHDDASRYSRRPPVASSASQ